MAQIKAIYFPKLIRDVRSDLKESQTVFGKRFGLSHNSISMYESGKFPPPLKVFMFCMDYRYKLEKKK